MARSILALTLVALVSPLVALAAATEPECLQGASTTATTTGTIIVAWPAVQGAQSYQVIARAGDEGPWTPLNPQVPGGGTSFTYHPAAAGIVYDFVVVALSGPSAPIGSFCQVSRTGEGPPCPENVVASRDEGGIHVSWDPVAEADGYNVYRSLDFGDFQLIGHVTTTTVVDSETSHQGTDLAGMTREYMVRSTLQEGQSGGCRVATMPSVPFFVGPLAWKMGGVAILGATFVMMRRKEL